ncbi:hypothetical protein Hypma_012706 [Hypsizygus marmoreus]|uniref:Uncharacterized protein n=1 Tax=Hypsizygus marmoreus TaxID=39966 RepID=A0A369JNI5_HYPMA|nr:hypothetical protein Hypma_012706 [Hypsizygus marmoreus]
MCPSPITTRSGLADAGSTVAQHGHNTIRIPFDTNIASAFETHPTMEHHSFDANQGLLLHDSRLSLSSTTNHSLRKHSHTS